ncbi:MAG TPA: hypothetical protein VLA34_09830, partial [Candidatus Krumholzibacterium sp.]|nr:hypothetical protein [Candidatus Krumholzibacterium sp.]
MESKAAHKVTRILAAILIAQLMLISCGEKETIVEVPVEVPADCPPSPPRDVYAVNLDGFVSICFSPNPEEDVRYYDIYRSAELDGEYTRIAYIEDNYPDDDPWEYCYDDEVPNYGQQFFYSVVAVDEGENESTDLSDGYLTDIVSATPRHEGNVTLSDTSAAPASSGYDFSNLNDITQRYDDADTDIYFTVDGSARLVTDMPEVQIQDYGFVSLEAYGFDVLNYAPADGWSPSGTAEAIEGHVYFLRLGEVDGAHYVKLWLADVTATSVTFLWAYQTDPDNRDLAPGPEGTDGSITGTTGDDASRFYDGVLKIKRVLKGRQVPPT